MQRPIDLSADAITEFCRRRPVRRLAFFGSVIRGDYTPMSDVDVLVEFDATAGVGLLGLADMEIELGRLLGRKADIHTVNGLHPAFRDEVLREARWQYEQT